LIRWFIRWHVGKDELPERLVVKPTQGYCCWISQASDKLSAMVSCYGGGGGQRTASVLVGQPWSGAERRLLLITFLGCLGANVGLVLIIALAVVAARSSHS
jgi:hypothetical protein